MGQRAVDQTPKGVSQTRDGLRRDVEPECFDGDEAVVLRIVRAKNRSQNAAADLMQDAIRTKGERRGVRSRFVKRQRSNS